MTTVASRKRIIEDSFSLDVVTQYGKAVNAHKRIKMVESLKGATAKELAEALAVAQLETSKVVLPAEAGQGVVAPAWAVALEARLEARMNALGVTLDARINANTASINKLTNHMVNTPL